jgi:hypothetical protein
MPTAKQWRTFDDVSMDDDLGFDRSDNAGAKEISIAASHDKC